MFARRALEAGEVALPYRGQVFATQQAHARAFPDGSRYAQEAESGKRAGGPQAG